jgi:hypothetical protein
LRRFCLTLNSIAPVRAGDEGWSVATTSEALARAQIREGRAAPKWWISISWNIYIALLR